MYKISRPLGLILSDIIKNRLFVIGLIFKTLFILLFVPEIQTNWFVPFVVSAIENISLNPWNNYYDIGGSTKAFPYGPIMLLSQLPLTYFGWLVDQITELSYFTGFGFRISLLVADILLLLLILQQFESYKNKILIHYWLSPIVIFITYWHGQLDLIPLTIMIISIGLLKRNKIILSGILLALSVASKHSILIVFPFILVYIWSNKESIKDIYRFNIYFFACIAALEFNLLFDYGFQEMVIHNPEVEKIYWLRLVISENIQIYILPIIYILLVYFVWRLKKINYELIFISLGIAFGIFLLFTPASPGWFIWITPMLALHLSKKGNRAEIFGILLSIFFVIYHFLYSSGSQVIFLGDMTTFTKSFSILYQQKIQSSIYTSIIIIILIIMIQMLREGIKGNYYYNLGRRPIILGISGSLERERKIFVNFVIDMFGKNSVLKLSEEDYHNWSNESLAWGSISYLNPKSARLPLIVGDIRKTLSTSTKDNYWRKRPIVLVDGVHSFFLKQLSEIQDVKFFIESRKYSISSNDHFSLVGKDDKKIKKDIKKYIQPQRGKADIVFTLFNKIDKSNKSVMLDIGIRESIFYLKLMRILISVCGLQANIENIDEQGNVELQVRGEVDHDSVQVACNIAIPNLIELLKEGKYIYNGTAGIMQLILLMEIDDSLKRRMTTQC
jgi:uridine kinase